MKKFLILGACAAALTLPAAAQTITPGDIFDVVRGVHDASRGVNRYPYTTPYQYQYQTPYTTPETVPYQNYNPNYPQYQQQRYYNLSSPLDIVYTNLNEGATVGSAFVLQGYTTPFNRVDLSVNGRSNRVRQSTQADANGHFAVNVDASRIPFNSRVTVSARAIDGDGRVGPNNKITLVRR